MYKVCIVFVFVGLSLESWILKRVDSQPRLIQHLFTGYHQINFLYIHW